MFEEASQLVYFCSLSECLVLVLPALKHYRVYGGMRNLGAQCATWHKHAWNREQQNYTFFTGPNLGCLENHE
jgi:hypothetical protein